MEGNGVPPHRVQYESDGGEGNRTPDLLNAIQALSQLSYAPRSAFLGAELGTRQEPRRIAQRVGGVNELGLAKS